MSEIKWRPQRLSVSYNPDHPGQVNVWSPELVDQISRQNSIEYMEAEGDLLERVRAALWLTSAMSFHDITSLEMMTTVYEMGSGDVAQEDLVTHAKTVLSKMFSEDVCELLFK